MKNRSSIIIIIVTAVITFGTLFAVKGGMYSHQWRFQSQHCTKDVHEDTKNDFQSEKADEEGLDQSNK